MADLYRGYSEGLLADDAGFDRPNTDALMRSLLGQGEYADSGMILPFAKAPSGETLLSFPAPIQAVARTSARAMGGIPLDIDPYTGLPSEDVLADAAEAAGMFTGAGLLAPKPSGALGMSGGGGTTRVIPPRDVDELGFYSQALEAAKNLPQAKGTGQQFEKMLLGAGVKPDEIVFTPELRGLLDQPQITREELVSLLQENRIRPQETVLYGGDEDMVEGMNFPAEAELLDVYQAYGSQYVDEVADDLMFSETEYFLDAIGDIPKRTQYGDIPDTREKIEKALLFANVDELDTNTEIFLRQKAEEMAIDRYNYDPVLRLQDPDTGYEIVGSDETGYIIRDEGGQSITDDVPFSLSEARIQAETHAMDQGLVGYGGGETRFSEYTESGGNNYREMLLQVPEYRGMRDEFYETGHFDEPNIVVHARTKDRKMAKDAGDTLYVEEMQSDWGQRGRRMGFDTPKDKEKLQSNIEKFKPIQEEMDKQRGLKKEATAEFAKLVADQIGGVSSGGAVKLHDKAVLNAYNTNEILASGAGNIDLYDPLSGQYRNFGVTVPKEIKDRWKSARDEFNKLDAESKPLQKLVRKTADIPIAPFVGSSEKFAEVGIKRLLSQAVKEGKKYVSFSSGDVQYDRWNEEGLVPFYDEIIPKVAKKVAKRFDPDAQVGDMQVRMSKKDMSDKADRLTIEITPKMRESIQEGVPLFVSGGQGLLAAGQGMRQDQQQSSGIMF